MSVRRNTTILLVAVLTVVACSSEEPGVEISIPPGEGAATPVEAVEELVEAINGADFVDASRFAIPTQAALASLAEGATFSDIAGALRDGDEEIAANFWAGFAQGSGDFLTETTSTSEDGTIDREGLEYRVVRVVLPDGSDRVLMVRDVDGYRVDLFASFGAGLAQQMSAQVERLLSTQTDDARLILSHLGEIVPSLLLAAEMPGITTEVTQQILGLVELITRVG